MQKKVKKRKKIQNLRTRRKRRRMKKKKMKVRKECGKKLSTDMMIQNQEVLCVLFLK